MTESFIRRYWFILLYLAIYFVAINLVVLNRFWQFETFYFDHGIYDSTLWQAAHFQIPYVDLIDYYNGGFVRQIGNHFTPTFYLLSPIYWFTSAYEPVLILQNLIVTLSAVVIFFVAKAKIANRLMVGAIVFAYTMFIGLQNLLISNLHADAMATLTLALIFWSLEKKKWLHFWIFLILTLGVKENFASVGVALGIFLIFQRQFKMGIFATVFSLVYYFATIKLFMPFLGQQNYLFTNSLHSPMESIRQIFFPLIKSQTIGVSFLTFGLLPIFNFGFLFVIFQDFFTRFVLNSGSARWDLGLHYNATLSVILAYGAILGVSELSKNHWYKKLISVHALIIILTAVYFHRVLYHGPLGLSYNPVFYSHSKVLEPLKKFVNSIPQKELTMTQNNLAPYLTHETITMLLRGDYQKWKPDLIVIDNHGGQNPNAFWPMTETTVAEMTSLLDQDLNYSKNGQTPGRVYYERVRGFSPTRGILFDSAVPKKMVDLAKLKQIPSLSNPNK